jgi:hypothetical protein
MDNNWIVFHQIQQQMLDGSTKATVKEPESAMILACVVAIAMFLVFLWGIFLERKTFFQKTK